MKIKPGSVVVLNSGGPAMTVIDVTGVTAHCTWNAQPSGAALQHEELTAQRLREGPGEPYKYSGAVARRPTNAKFMDGE